MDQETPSPDAPEPWVVRLAQYLPWHMRLYGGVAVLLVLLNYISPADRGVFIPMMLWGVAVLAHYLTVRAINTDPDWVEERSEMITMNASDLSHIEDIRERHDKRMAEAEAKQATLKNKNQKAE